MFTLQQKAKWNINDFINLKQTQNEYIQLQRKEDMSCGGWNGIIYWNRKYVSKKIVTVYFTVLVRHSSTTYFTVVLLRVCHSN